jgi:hypothetical protein
MSVVVGRDTPEMWNQLETLEENSPISGGDGRVKAVIY